MTVIDQFATEFVPFPAFIRAHAESQGEREALCDGDAALTWGEFDAHVDRIAARLQAEAVGPGDRVAIAGRNSIEFVLVYAAILRIGAVAALLTPSLAEEALLGMLADCGARHVFVDEVVGAALGNGAPSVACIALGEHAGSESLSMWMAPEGSHPEPVEIRSEDAFNIIYSSGTTGAPKGIVQSHAMRLAQIRRFVPMIYDRDSVSIISTPLYSNTTLVSLIPAIAAGGRAVLMPKFDAGGFCELAERERATHAMLVPAQYQRILSLPDFGSYDLSSFRFKSCTSAPFESALKRKILQRWPGRLIEFYGMTEGGGVCMLDAGEHPDKLHTVGRPTPSSVIRLIDAADCEVAPGEVGEVVGRSPAMMTGYYGQEGETRAVEWRDAAGESYIRHGDLGRFDEDGFLILVGRKKDMIISGGFNIYPSDLEAQLQLHSAVAEAAVIGTPSVEWGETPVAFVVLRAAAEPEQVLKDVNARLGRAQRIRSLHVIDEMPRNAIGKVLKRELRERFSRGEG